MFRLIDSLLFTFERLWQHRILVFWVLVGLSAATTLAMSLLLYVDAVNTGLLASRLTNPPYAVRFRYLGAWNGNIAQADVTSASAGVENGFVDTIGLPVAQKVTFLRGGAWTIRFEDNQPLGVFSLGSLEGAQSQMNITAGEWPPENVPDDVIPVLISDKMLFNMGVEVGDRLTATLPGGQPVTLQVAALWTPLNANDPSWIFTPKFFDEVFLLQPEALWSALEGIERPIDETAWYLVFDGSEVRTSDVTSILGNLADGERDASTILPGIRMDLSPRDGLTTFSEEVNILTQQLVIVIMPVGGLVLYFVALVAGLLVSRQQQEDVTLRSRGMNRSAIVGLHTQMWLSMAVIALGVGFVLSPLVVRLVGQTTSFLQFDDFSSPLIVTFTPQAIAAGALTGLIAASAGLLLAWRTSAQNINSFKRENARASRAWWQRMYLDVMLLVPAAYVLFTLWQRGGLVTDAENPFSDPLTFLAPTLFALGLTLLFLRLWPILLRLGAGLVSYGRGVALLMALRELTRSIGRYRGALLMMCFTLSLTGFTASMANTIDKSLADSVDYKIGADAVLVTVADAQAEQSTADDGSQSFTVTGFNTLPAEDLLQISGVTEVSRVGRFPARLTLTGQRIDGTVLGIDRAAIADVARSRFDYAAESYGALFNRLAGNRTGVLLDRKTLETYNLLLGQEITLQISALGEWHETKVPVVGVLDYFPTLDPRTGFFLITNLDPIMETVGTQLPYDIWLRLGAGADSEIVEQEARALGYPIIDWRNPLESLQDARAEPARRGVLGFLSVGFVASILLTLVGAIIQSTASFRAQAMQLGSLRAMGLSGFSVTSYLILLQGMAASSGIISGTTIGVITTVLFLPLLDFSGGLPPYLIRVAWDEIFLVYAVFAGVLFFVTMFTTIFLGRESLSAIVKLGDA